MSVWVPRLVLNAGILSGLCLAGGCQGREALDRKCIEMVAAEIEPRNASLAGLDVRANPLGEGLVVFAKSTRCAPEFMWVTISDGNLFEVYAVDAPSQKLTPRLGVLSGVPAGQTAKLGSDAESFSRRIREEFCRAPNGRL